MNWTEASAAFGVRNTTSAAAPSPPGAFPGTGNWHQGVPPVSVSAQPARKIRPPHRNPSRSRTGARFHTGYAVTVTSDWGSGYCANIDITNNNTGSADWVVTLSIEGSVSSLWNATWVQNGELLTIEGLSWNRTLAPGGSAQVGYCAVR